MQQKRCLLYCFFDDSSVTKFRLNVTKIRHDVTKFRLNVTKIRHDVTKIRHEVTKNRLGSDVK